MNMVGGLLLGTLLRVLVPYAREGLQRVAESGSWKSWPVFDWRYMAMVLLPVVEFGVAFLTVEGLWQAAMGWGFVQAVALAWAGADIGKEVMQVAATVGKVGRNGSG